MALNALCYNITLCSKIYSKSHEGSVTMPKQTDAFTANELDRIFVAGKDRVNDKGRPRKLASKEEQELFVKVLYYTAARVSEIVGADGLTPERIVFERKLIILRNLKNKRNKPNRYKEINIMNQEFLDELKLYITLNQIEPSQRIFPISRSTANRIVKDLAKEAGIHRMGLKKPHCHNFRHTYIDLGKRLGLNEKLLADQAGHSSLAMMGSYADIKAEDIEALKKLNRKSN